jgi:hypothetical protein
MNIEFTLPPPVEVIFAEPEFRSLERLSTSGNYRGPDGRYYYWELLSSGQRVMISGDFAVGATALRFQLQKKRPIQLPEPTSGLAPGRGSS